MKSLCLASKMEGLASKTLGLASKMKGFACCLHLLHFLHFSCFAFFVSFAVWEGGSASENGAFPLEKAWISWGEAPGTPGVQ